MKYFPRALQIKWMGKIIFIKNVQEITLFCKLHYISKKNAWYNSGTKFKCYAYQIASKCIITAKILSFSRPLNFLKINFTESYDFFFSSVLSCENSVDFLLIRETFNILCTSHLVSCLTGSQIWPSGRNKSTLMKFKNGILNVPKTRKQARINQFRNKLVIDSLRLATKQWCQHEKQTSLSTRLCFQINTVYLSDG